ncbi:MAG: phospho-N-acetylmuramoyl-pentapeptide-transferase [Clostridiaceae bacterium]|nr:phospho-N-acetylmuramoyl-pentapeptide-transferase [Clostridiaceae bacterium]HZW98328.1 phospho-N-acetylmuramoyl-pentapeptide-transferase [Bacillota bacterium]
MTQLWQAIILFTIMLLATVLTGLIGLPMLRKFHLFQTVRDDGPKSHYSKTGTPTFGGLFFLTPLAIIAVILPIANPRLLPFSVVALLMLLFGLIGFLDDFIKVRIDKGGLSVKQKTVLIGVFSILFTLWYLFIKSDDPIIILPFARTLIVISGWWKLPYGIFVVLFIFFISNSVNITDGLDGLLSGLTVISSVFLAITAWLLKDLISAYFSSLLLSIVMAAGCLGFLVFNRHPAKVFMGDTGSQALGAGFAGISLMLGVPWLMLITGFVFVFEGLSVVLQFLYFRRTKGKRIFRMAPIHHHFELGGWKETKVVAVFCLVAVACGLLGLLTIYAF